MILSYFLADESGIGKILLIAGSLVAMSLIPFGLLHVFLYAFPLFYMMLSSLSFPFYTAFTAIILERIEIRSYSISFFTMETISFPPESLFSTGFLVLLSANALGALLGHWISMKLTGSFERKLFDFFLKSTVLSWVICDVAFFAAIYFYTPASGDILSVLSSFCLFLFWVPALIATAYYGLLKRVSGQAR